MSVGLVKSGSVCERRLSVAAIGVSEEQVCDVGGLDGERSRRRLQMAVRAAVRVKGQRD